MAFAPKGKTFTQRVDACIDDAKKVHGVTIRQDAGRTAEWHLPDDQVGLATTQRYMHLSAAALDAAIRLWSGHKTGTAHPFRGAISSRFRVS